MGDSAFPARPWLLKAYPDTTKNQKEVYFNKTLRAARVVSEHAYGMLKGRWRLIYKKTESRRRNIKAVIMACIALHNLCIGRSDLCIPRWQLRVENLDLIRKRQLRRHVGFSIPEALGGSLGPDPRTQKSRRDFHV